MAHRPQVVSALFGKEKNKNLSLLPETTQSGKVPPLFDYQLQKKPLQNFLIQLLNWSSLLPEKIRFSNPSLFFVSLLIFCMETSLKIVIMLTLFHTLVISPLGFRLIKTAIFILVNIFLFNFRIHCNYLNRRRNR